MSNIIKSASLSTTRQTIVNCGENRPPQNTVQKNSAASNQKDEEVNERIQEAEEMITSAKKISEEIVEKAHSEAEEIRVRAREQARNEGYEQGYAKGVAQGKKEGKEEIRGETEEFLTKVRDLVYQAQKAKKNLLLESEMQLVRLAVGIAEKIIGREIEEDMAVIRHSIRQGLENINYPREVVIRLSPETREHLNGFSEELPEIASGIKDLEIETSPALDPGDCLLETRMGTIDCRIASQLDEIERQLLALVQSRGEESE